LGQKVEAFFDEEISPDTLVAPVLPLAEGTDSLKEVSLVVDTLDESEHYRTYDWYDVRDTRDSLRRELRATRSHLRKDVRKVRDFVREDLYAMVDSIPHEVRIGWGDMLFEMLVWHESAYPTSLPEEYMAIYNEQFRYTQHWFAEYMYNASYWYSIGCMLDFSGVLWDEVTRNGHGEVLTREKNHWFSNISIVPTIRFSYYRSPYVSLYSSLGIGLNINTGSELDFKGRRTAMAPMVNISLLGVRVGHGRWFGAVELGGMISLLNTNEVYMLGSRLFTASFGCCF
jgi:hypothetical protein